MAAGVSPDSHGRSDRRIFAFLTIALVATRLGFFVFLGAFDPVGDEGTYVKRGYAFLEITKQWLAAEDADSSLVRVFYHHGWHPPLSALIAGVPYKIGGLWLARSLQAVIGIASGIFFFRLARIFLGFRFGLLAYGLFVINPYLLGFSGFLWSENTYILLTTLLLLWFHRSFYDETPGLRGGSLRTVAAGAILMGLLWLCRSSFTPVFLGLLAVLIFAGRDRRREVPLFLLAGFIGLLFSLPWDVLIYLHEGRLFHGTTIASVQLATKFNDLDISGWLPVWKHVNEAARTKGTHFSDEAMALVLSYFASLDGRYGEVLPIVKHSFVERYLFGGSFLKRQFFWTYYPPGSPALSLAVLAYDGVIRQLLVWMGCTGLLFGAMAPRVRMLLVTVFFCNAAIGVIGLSNGRYIVVNYPLLIIGAVALWAAAYRRGAAGAALFTALAAAVLLPMAAYPPVSVEGAVPAAYVKAIRGFGRSPSMVRDLVSLRSVEGCAGEVKLRLDAAPDQDVLLREVRGKSTRLYDNAELAVAGAEVDLYIFQGPHTPRDSLGIVADGVPLSVPLDATTWGGWHRLGESCVETQWYGARKHFFDYHFTSTLFGREKR